MYQDRVKLTACKNVGAGAEMHAEMRFFLANQHLIWAHPPIYTPYGFDFFFLHNNVQSAG